MIIIGITWNEDSCHVEKLVSGEVEFHLETAVFAFVFVFVFVSIFLDAIASPSSYHPESVSE